jgi:hypothetical protein
MAEIEKDDLFSDELLMAPLVLAKNLEVAVNTAKQLVDTFAKIGKDISGATSTTALRKATGELTTEQQELIKVQNQLAVALAKNSDEYREQQARLIAVKKELKEKSVLGEKDAKTIDKQTSSLIELRAALDKNRAAFSSMRSESERTSKGGQELLSIIQKQDQQVKELSATIGKHTDNVGNYEGAMRKLKDEIRASQGEMIGIAATLGTSSKEFIKAAEKTGQLKDELQDMQQAANAVSGSPFENFGTSLGLVGSKLKNLDFKGAADAAKQFAAISRGITFKEAIGGVTDFGKTALTVGRALLTNPLVLLAAVIIGIAVAVVSLKDKIKPLSDAFNFLGDIINGVVQAGKDFLDWVGLTTFAADEKSEAIISGAEKELVAIQKRYDDEIDFANAANKKTLGLEKEKWKAILDQARIGDKEFLKLAKESSSNLTEEQLKRWATIGETIKEANKQLRIIGIKEGQENLKAQEELHKQEQKQREENEKARTAERLREKGAFFQLNQFRINNTINANQLILQNQEKSDEERFLAAENAMKARIELADLEFENAIAKAKGSEVVLLKEQQEQKVTFATLQGIKDRQDIEEQARQKRLKSDREIAETTTKGLQRVAQFDIDTIKNQVAQNKKTKEQGAAEILEIEKELAQKTIEENIKALEVILQTELLTKDERKAIDQELFNFRSQLADELFKNTQDKNNETQVSEEERLSRLTNIYQNFADSVGLIFNTLTDNRLQNLDLESEALQSKMENELRMAGENEEAKAKIQNDFARKQVDIERKRIDLQRRQAMFNKATGAIEAAINTAVAVTKVLATPPLAISIGIFGAAQVAAILAKQIPTFSEGGIHKGGLLIAGEKGIEKIEVPGHAPFLSPDAATLLNAPAGTKITSNEETMKQLAGSQLFYERKNDKKSNADSHEIIKELKKLGYIIENKKEVHWSVSRKGIEKAFKSAQTMTYWLDNFYG